MQNESNILAFVANGKGIGLTRSSGMTADVASVSAAAPHEFHHYLADIEDLIRAMAVIAGEESCPERDVIKAQARAEIEGGDEDGGVIWCSPQALFFAASHRQKRTRLVLGAGVMTGLLLGFGLGVVFAGRV